MLCCTNGQYTYGGIRLRPLNFRESFHALGNAASDTLDLDEWPACTLTTADAVRSAFALVVDSGASIVELFRRKVGLDLELLAAPAFDSAVISIT
jgi:hypothetical protein